MSLLSNSDGLIMSNVRKTVLLVDDDQSILRVFTRVLERKGYSVITAENGGDATRKIETSSFDAALIDFRLPDIDGTALLPKIEEKLPKAVKIIFTGYSDLDCAENGGNRHIDAFLIKPVKPEVLLDILSKKLYQREILS
jgi:DNA-binding NtrC family response regulator